MAPKVWSFLLHFLSGLKQGYMMDLRGLRICGMGRNWLGWRGKRLLFNAWALIHSASTEIHGLFLIFSPFGIAIAYALNHWAALARLLDDGIIAIDNAAAEQAVRGIATGRKNWLFLGSDNGGRAAAIHYTLIQTAKRHGIDPYGYTMGDNGCNEVKP